MTGKVETGTAAKLAAFLNGRHDETVIHTGKIGPLKSENGVQKLLVKKEMQLLSSFLANPA